MSEIVLTSAEFHGMDDLSSSWNLANGTIDQLEEKGRLRNSANDYTLKLDMLVRFADGRRSLRERHLNKLSEISQSKIGFSHSLACALVLAWWCGLTVRRSWAATPRDVGSITNSIQRCVR